ncbi:MAG: hypothetical protein VX022_02520 [Candidatus Thermoplasmatota archaeon]|nr:hypothetical protein [Candidatus Thermoplasmatota archaeon]
MSASRLLSEKLSSFEKYNNKELYNFGSGSFSFVITGRLISGTIGFVIIILMLMVTFSSAANSIMVSELGGSKAFTADVVLTELSGPSFSGTLNNEGEFVEFGYLVDDIDWDYSAELKISHIDIQVIWDANGGAGGGRQVTFEVSSENNTVGESQTDGGNGGTLTTVWLINQIPETVSDTADSADDFVRSYETPGDWVGGRFTYSSESIGSIALNDSIDYTISLTYFTWNFENIREIVEI